MKRIYSSFLVIAHLLLISDAVFSQAQRTLGGSRLDLDDNAGAHVFLTNASNSVGINSLGTQPNICALLDLSSTTKGLLVPRMNSLQELAVCSGTPPEGLIVYNTTTHSLDVYNGSTWGSSAGWGLLGNGGTNSAVNFLGTTDAQDLVIRTNNTEKMRIRSGGNVSIGVPAGFGLLDVNQVITSTVFGTLQDNELTLSPSAPTGGQFDGLALNFQANSPNTMSGGLLGVFSTVQSSTTSTGAIGQMVGVLGNVGNYSAAPITRADAVYAQIQSQGTGGSMTDAANFRGSSFIAGSQSVTNLRGLFINNPGVSGTVTNNFGIDIDQLTSGINNTAFRYNHATLPFIIQGNGFVRLGNPAPAFDEYVDITRSSNATSATVITVEQDNVAQNSSPSTSEFLGSYSLAQASNTATINPPGGMFGVWGEGRQGSASTATVDRIRGVLGEADNQSSQTANSAVAVSGLTENFSVGSMGIGSGLRATLQNSGGGTITNARLIDVADLINTSGTITNTYGLYVGAMVNGTQTNKAYSIYASDVNARNFFNGRSGFGTGTSPASSPQTNVDINGALSIEYSNVGFGIFAAGTDIDPNNFGEQGFSSIGSNPGGILNGIQHGTNGRILILHKSGTAMTISNEDLAVPAGDRIHCVSGGSPVIPAGEAIITFIYEGSSGLNRWLIQSVNTAF